MESMTQSEQFNSNQVIKSNGHVDLHSRLYIPIYTKEILRGLIRPHRPRLEPKINETCYTMTVRKRDPGSWLGFVGFKNGDKVAPLTYYNSAGAFALFDILAQLKINFSSLLHLKAEVEVVDKSLCMEAGQQFSITMSLESIIPRDRQCIIVVGTSVRDLSGKEVRRHRDFWFIKRWGGQHLKHSLVNSKFDSSEFKGISKRQSQLYPNRHSLTQRSIPIEKKAGNSFAKISGDYNVIHTTHWGAKLCGQQRPFLQGFGILNLALHHISQEIDTELNHFSISFSRPTLVDQTLSLIMSDGIFELCSDGGSLIAFGTYR